MTEQDNSWGEHWGWSIAALVLLLPNVLWSTFVITKIWAWFIPLPSISLKVAFGMAILSSYMTNEYDDNRKQANAGQAVLIGLIKPALILGFCYFMKLIFEAWF